MTTTIDMTEDEANAQAASEGPAAPTPVVFIIGAGVVGTALAARLSRAGVPVAGVHGRRSELSDAAGGLSGVLASTGEIPEILSESEVVIISVRDERIPEVAERLAKEKRLRADQVVLHTSGAHPAAEVLAPAAGKVKGRGTLHPLMSFADPRLAAEGLKGVAFGIEGEPAARAVALRLVRAVGGRPLLLESKNMALYHAGAVVASNYVVALADIARTLLTAAGVPQDQALPSLVPLLGSAVRNLADVGLPDAITGPIVRGDVQSVERHLATLASRLPATLDIYRRLGQEVLRIARQKTSLDAASAERLEALFGVNTIATARPSPSSSSASPTRKKR